MSRFKISSDRAELNGLSGLEITRTERSVTLDVGWSVPVTVPLNDVRPA